MARSTGWYIGNGLIDGTGARLSSDYNTWGGGSGLSATGQPLPVVPGQPVGVVLLANPIEFDKEPAVVHAIEGAVSVPDCSTGAVFSANVSLQKVKLSKGTNKYGVHWSDNPSQFECGGSPNFIWIENRTWDTGVIPARGFNQITWRPQLSEPVQLHSDEALIIFLEVVRPQGTNAGSLIVDFSVFLRYKATM